MGVLFDEITAQQAAYEQAITDLKDAIPPAALSDLLAAIDDPGAFSVTAIMRALQARGSTVGFEQVASFRARRLRDAARLAVGTATNEEVSDGV
jgi:hypothetical protein